MTMTEVETRSGTTAAELETEGKCLDHLPFIFIGLIVKLDGPQRTEHSTSKIYQFKCNYCNCTVIMSALCYRGVCVFVSFLLLTFKLSLWCLFSPHHVNEGGVQKVTTHATLYEPHTDEESLLLKNYLANAALAASSSFSSFSPPSLPSRPCPRTFSSALFLSGT